MDCCAAAFQATMGRRIDIIFLVKPQAMAAVVVVLFLFPFSPI
jgi:hypothetical protein